MFNICFQIVVEYGAVEGSSTSFNSPNFAASSIVSALSILDNVVNQPENPTIVSFTKFTGPSDGSDAATPVLLSIAKIFGNFYDSILKIKKKI